MGCGDQQEVSRWPVVTEAAQVQEPLQCPGSHRFLLVTTHWSHHNIGPGTYLAVVLGMGLPLVTLVTLVLGRVSAEDTCHVMAKGDNSYPGEAAASDGEQGGRRHAGAGQLVSAGRLEWEQLDWRSYQLRDLTEEDRRRPLERFSVNLVTSAQLDPNRTIPDNRDEACSSVQYDLDTLGQSSVIITFR